MNGLRVHLVCHHRLDLKTRAIRCHANPKDLQMTVLTDTTTERRPIGEIPYVLPVRADVALGASAGCELADADEE